MITLTYPALTEGSATYDLRTKIYAGGFTTSRVKNNLLEIHCYAGECRDAFHIALYSSLDALEGDNIVITTFANTGWLAARDGLENQFKKFYQLCDGIPHIEKIKFKVIPEELESTRAYWRMATGRNDAIVTKDTIKHGIFPIEITYPIELLPSSIVPWLLLLVVRQVITEMTPPNLQKTSSVFEYMRKHYSDIILTDKPELIRALWKSEILKRREGGLLTFNGPMGLISWIKNGYQDGVKPSSSIAQLRPLFSCMHKYVNYHLLSIQKVNLD